MEMRPDVHERTSERLESLADGIFAFAMTLLVLNIQIPVLNHRAAVRALPMAIFTLWPHIFAFITSFAVLAVFWAIHHKHFTAIRKVNDVIIWINMGMLMMVVLLPFTTAMFGEYGDVFLAAILFELNMFAIGIMFFVNYVYALRRGLVDKNASKGHIRSRMVRNLVIPGISLVAMAIAIFSPQFSVAAYYTLPVFLATILKD